MFIHKHTTTQKFPSQFWRTPGVLTTEENNFLLETVEKQSTFYHPHTMKRSILAIALISLVLLALISSADAISIDKTRMPKAKVNIHQHPVSHSISQDPLQQEGYYELSCHLPRERWTWCYWLYTKLHFCWLFQRDQYCTYIHIAYFGSNKILVTWAWERYQIQGVRSQEAVVKT